MSHANEDLLREAIAAFQRGDSEALREKYFAEDIRYHIGGRSAISGDYEGVAQVLEGFGRIFQLSAGTFRVELHDVLGSDEHGVALFTARAEREGRQLEANEVLICHLHDGKMTEVWAQGSDQFAAAEFWA